MKAWLSFWGSSSLLSSVLYSWFPLPTSCSARVRRVVVLIAVLLLLLHPIISSPCHPINAAWKGSQHLAGKWLNSQSWGLLYYTTATTCQPFKWKTIVNLYFFFSRWVGPSPDELALLPTSWLRGCPQYFSCSCSPSVFDLYSKYLDLYCKYLKSISCF